MTDIADSYFYVSILKSQNFPFSVQLTWGQCGSWHKECLWSLKAWPYRSEVVYVVPAGNNSLHIQMRSNMMFPTKANPFLLRPLSDQNSIRMTWTMFCMFESFRENFYFNIWNNINALTNFICCPKQNYKQFLKQVYKAHITVEKTIL